MKEHLKKYFPERFEDPGLNPNSLLYYANYLGNERSRVGCERLVLEVMERSNELKLLRGAMKKYGCDFKLSRHVACEACNGCPGGFDPDTNQIVICHNYRLTKNRVMSLMMHEMIHMFDFCRAKFDFSNLEHVACSEIRASNLSHCTVVDKINVSGPNSGWFEFKKGHKYCVKDIAFRAVQAYSPETESEKIWSIIDKVFPYCYNDLEPFGRRPTNGTDDFRQSYRERFYYGYV